MVHSVKEIAITNGIPRENVYNDFFKSPGDERQSQFKCKVTFEDEVYEYEV